MCLDDCISCRPYTKSIRCISPHGQLTCFYAADLLKCMEDSEELQSEFSKWAEEQDEQTCEMLRANVSMQVNLSQTSQKL